MFIYVIYHLHSFKQHSRLVQFNLVMQYSFLSVVLLLLWPLNGEP